MKILENYPGLEVEAAKRLIENLAISDKDVLSYMTYTVTGLKGNDSSSKNGFSSPSPAVHVNSPEKMIAA
jgi:hypothetical protein